MKSYKQFSKTAKALEGAKIITAKTVKNYWNTIPKGSIGTISNIKSGYIRLQSEPCQFCGVAIIVDHLDYDIIESLVNLTPEHEPLLNVNQIKSEKPITYKQFLKQNQLKRICDLVGKKIRTTKPLRNGYQVLPKGYIGTFNLRGKKCIRGEECSFCHTKVNMSGLSFDDFEIINDL